MKQIRKRPRRRSPQLSPDHPESEVAESAPISGVRKCREKVKRQFSGLEMQRAQLVIQAEALQQEIQRMEAQRGHFYDSAEIASKLGDLKEVQAYEAGLRELEAAESEVVCRLDMIEELIAEINAQLP